ncbi:MAG: BapA prefix-like domain-containing protein, partial [Sulfitobacter sp.]|nr:BapA prefix-like domain-containing protein [Sulfitobacter sp.]
MKAIDFVVRDSAGGLQRGVVPSEARSHVIQAGSGQQISLNLRQVDLQSHQRQGDDLVITLSDGREITIDNYFNGSGTPNRLFISADGYLNEVAFVDTGAGELYAQFGPTEQWGKWSPSDDLIYLGRTELAAAGVADDEVSMFAAPLLGAGLLGGGGAAAAAVVGGAAVLGTGGGNSDGGSGGGTVG